MKDNIEISVVHARGNGFCRVIAKILELEV
jgi:hypothetical protein